MCCQIGAIIGIMSPLTMTSYIKAACVTRSAELTEVKIFVIKMKKTLLMVQWKYPFK